MDIKISVIIPNYISDFFERISSVLGCLNSIANSDLSQELYEVILVDDCSPADIDVIRNYSKIRNYRFYRLGVNGGVSMPRNFGINQAFGKYLMFIDNDDTISSGFLSKTLDIAEQGDCDVVIGKKIAERPSAADYKKLTEDILHIPANNKELQNFFFSDNWVTGKLYRMDLIRRFGVKFPDNLRKREDPPFSKWFWAISNTAGICASEQYFLNDSSSLNRLSDTGFENEDAFEQIYFILKNICSIPDEFTPLEKKARILSVRLNHGYIKKLLESPHYLQLLNKKCSKYFLIFKNTPLGKDARNFINTVLNFPS